MHHLYFRDRINHDFGLAQVEDGIKFSPTVQPIRLWSDLALNHDSFRIAGWGAIILLNTSASDDLMELNPAYKSDCTGRYDERYVLCLFNFNKGVYLGDSGASVVLDHDGQPFSVAVVAKGPLVHQWNKRSSGSILVTPKLAWIRSVTRLAF